MKLLKWKIQNGSYFANICMIGNEIIQFEIIPYTDGTFGLFINNNLTYWPRRLKTAQNRAQKVYNQFLEDQRKEIIE